MSTTLTHNPKTYKLTPAQKRELGVTRDVDWTYDEETNKWSWHDPQSGERGTPAFQKFGGFTKKIEFLNHNRENDPEKQDWYVAADQIGEQPSYNKLPKEDDEKIYNHYMAKGYSREETIKAIKSVQNKKYSAYQNKVAQYNATIDKYHTSQSKLLDQEMVNQYGVDYSEKYSEDQIASFKTVLAENKEERGVFGEGDQLSYTQKSQTGWKYNASNISESAQTNRIIQEALGITTEEEFSFENKTTFSPSEIQRINNHI